MKKSTIGIIVAITIIVFAALVLLLKSNNNTTNTSKLQTTQEMINTMNSIYEKLGDTLPNIETNEIDISDELAVTAATGLKSTSNIEGIVLSEPFISAQAYSAVLVKVSNNANIEEMKQEMLDNIDTRKWICVEAEKVYVTNYGNIIFLIMSSDEWAKPVYDEFKNTVGGKVGKELQK